MKRRNKKIDDARPAVQEIRHRDGRTVGRVGNQGKNKQAIYLFASVTNAAASGCLPNE